MLRSGAVPIAITLGAILLSQRPLPAQQQDLYPATLQFGTGLIDIPVAWVSPNSGDIWVQSSAKRIPYGSGDASLNLASTWNTNLAIDTHWARRFSLGVSLYSQNPEVALFGQALLVREQPDKGWPSIAVGFRNLGTLKHEDRFLIGHDVSFDSDGGSNGHVAPHAQHFQTAPSIYGAATKSFMVGGNGSASFTLGFGSGLFYDDGDLGDAYNDKGQIAKGLFLGGRYAVHPTENTRIDLLAENNGWDWNAGVVASWRGLSLGVYATELEEGSKSPSKGPLYNVYNYTKVNVSLGYSANVFDIARGVVLRTRVGELEREQARLRAELQTRERRVAELESQLRVAQAGELAQVAKQRQELEAQIQAEREAIKRAEERLKALQSPDQPKKPQDPQPPER
ncbi:MAG TPA: hypothetical protein VFK39_05980 [Gemmatimonadaceae bacterium]|nr:hypothetical protein [Gemmatimonadaceae bacterium]